MWRRTGCWDDAIGVDSDGCVSVMVRTRGVPRWERVLDWLLGSTRRYRVTGVDERGVLTVDTIDVEIRPLWVRVANMFRRRRWKTVSRVRTGGE